MKYALVLLFFGSSVHATSRCQDDLIKFVQTVATMRAEFARTPADPRDVGWVKKKLAHMVAVDQFMRKQSDLPHRHAYDEADRASFNEQYMRRFRDIDQANTAEVHRLLELYPWFTISRFGAEADNDAWLLVQHADEDPALQERVLEILTDLWPKKETNARNYAYLFDRVAASFSDATKRKLQRYGTQGHCVGPGAWEPIPMEEPAKIDERRASVGLGPLADYKLMFKDSCR